MKPCGPELFVGNFQIIDSVFLLVIDLFRFSVSSWFILGRLYVSRDLPFLQGCPNLFLFNIISQGPLYFCSISCNTSSFFSNFESSFFLGESIYMFVCLVYIFFLKLLVLLTLSIVFLVCVSFVFAPCFVIFSLLLTLGFIWSSFYSSLRCIMRLFWVLSCFLIQSFIAMSFLIRTAFAVSRKFCMLYFHFISLSIFLIDFFFDPLVSQQCVA